MDPELMRFIWNAFPPFILAVITVAAALARQEILVWVAFAATAFTLWRVE